MKSFHHRGTEIRSFSKYSLGFRVSVVKGFEVSS
jgi:hypothetical protein